MIYIKVRKQVPQVSQVVTLSPMKQEKALLGLSYTDIGRHI